MIPALHFSRSRFLKGRHLRVVTIKRHALARRLLAATVLQLGINLIGAGCSSPGHAQKLVDPKSVAPEYRDAAEKRRAEQIKLVECSRSADIAKVARRDSAANVNQCIEKIISPRARSGGGDVISASR
jgi:hypothetical protein